MTGWRGALNQYKAASRRGKRENDRGTNEPLSVVSRETHTHTQRERERERGGWGVPFFSSFFFFVQRRQSFSSELQRAAPGTRRGSLASHPLTFVMLPEKGSRGMPTARTLPTLTDLGPRLRPIHEIILVHHLRALLVSRGCAPWITLTAVCRLLLLLLLLLLWIPNPLSGIERSATRNSGEKFSNPFANCQG